MKTYRVSYRLKSPAFPHVALLWEITASADSELKAEHKAYPKMVDDAEFLFREHTEEFVWRSTIRRIK